jgi:hypothetical protein
MIGMILLLVWGQEAPAREAADIWSEIAQVEALVTDTVKSEESQYTITSQGPVRGYYVSRRGVVLMIPLRYQARIDTRLGPSLIADPESPDAPPKLSRLEIRERLKAWQDEMRKQRILKEANFEKVIANLTAAIPQIIRQLDGLPGEESLTVIIEERVPSWYYPGFSLDKNPTTKIVTLTIDNKALIAEVHAGRTELRGNWQAQVERTNADRDIVSLIP